MPTWDFPAAEGYALSSLCVHIVQACAPHRAGIARPKGLSVQSKHVRQEDCGTFVYI